MRIYTALFALYITALFAVCIQQSNLNEDLSGNVNEENKLGTAGILLLVNDQER